MAVTQIQINPNELVFRLSNGSLYVTGDYAGCGLNAGNRLLDKNYRATKFVSGGGYGLYVQWQSTVRQNTTPSFVTKSCTEAYPEGYPNDWTVADAAYVAGGDGAPEVWTPGWRFLVNDYDRVEIRYAVAPAAGVWEEAPAESVFQEYGSCRICGSVIFAPLASRTSETARLGEETQIPAGAGGYEVQELLYQYPNLTIVTTAVDEGYCQNNHCHCTPGFAQLVVWNEGTQTTKSVCAATCPCGTAWLSWLDKCVVVSGLAHWNYSDGGDINRPD